MEDKLTDGEKALDIGSGSGYLTACMALMIGSRGRVIGVEHIPELVDKSIENVQIDHPELLSSNRVKFKGKKITRVSTYNISQMFFVTY